MSTKGFRMIGNAAPPSVNLGRDLVDLNAKFEKIRVARQKAAQQNKTVSRRSTRSNISTAANAQHSSVTQKIVSTKAVSDKNAKRRPEKKEEDRDGDNDPVRSLLKKMGQVQ